VEGIEGKRERTVVVHGDEGPVGNHASDANSIGVVRGRSWAGDEVLNGCGVEQLDVREL
jgi:hypothetical protein